MLPDYREIMNALQQHARSLAREAMSRHIQRVENEFINSVGLRMLSESPSPRGSKPTVDALDDDDADAQ